MWITVEDESWYVQFQNDFATGCKKWETICQWQGNLSTADEWSVWTKLMGARDSFWWWMDYLAAWLCMQTLVHQCSIQEWFHPEWVLQRTIHSRMIQMHGIETDTRSHWLPSWERSGCSKVGGTARWHCACLTSCNTHVCLHHGVVWVKETQEGKLRLVFLSPRQKQQL